MSDIENVRAILDEGIGENLSQDEKKFKDILLNDPRVTRGSSEKIASFAEIYGNR